MEKNTNNNILVVQQNGSGEKKIQGIREYGDNLFDLDSLDINQTLPEIIDDCTSYLPSEIDADLVLDYLSHPDLSQDLIDLCKNLRIPIVSTGKKIHGNWAYNPPICCALAKNSNCGLYSEKFGYPEFEVIIKSGKIEEVKVIRGAPCGATWKAIENIKGLPVEEAIQSLGLEIQFFCTADPASWDPLVEKSPVHLAGKIHSSALRAAVKKALRS